MAAQDIITAAEAKVYLGVSGSDLDTPIGTFISDVSSWIEEYLGRKVKGSQTVTDEIGSGDGTEFYIPLYPPVTAVSTLKYRDDPTQSWADLVTDTDYILIDPEGDYIEIYNGAFPEGRANIKVTYTAGYSTTPNAIKQVCYEMVAMRFRESHVSGLGDERLGVSSRSSAESGVTYSKSFEDMMPKWERRLRKYMRPCKQATLVR